MNYENKSSCGSYTDVCLSLADQPVGGTGTQLIYINIHTPLALCYKSFLLMH